MKKAIKEIKDVISKKVDTQFSFVPEDSAIEHCFSKNPFSKPVKKQVIREAAKYCVSLTCFILLFAFCCSAITLALVDEKPIREIFFEIGTRKRNELTVAIPDETYYKDSIDEIYYPRYIPEGYEMKLCIDTASQKLYTGYKDKEFITFAQYATKSKTDGNNFIINGRDAIISQIIINDRTITFIDGAGFNFYLWNKSGYLFTLQVTDGVSASECETIIKNIFLQ